MAALCDFKICTGNLARYCANMLILLGSIPVHWGSGWMFSNVGGGWEYPVFLVIVSAAVALIGDGAWALRLPWVSQEHATVKDSS